MSRRTSLDSSCSSLAMFLRASTRSRANRCSANDNVPRPSATRGLPRPRGRSISAWRSAADRVLVVTIESPCHDCTTHCPASQAPLLAMRSHATSSLPPPSTGLPCSTLRGRTTRTTRCSGAARCHIRDGRPTYPRRGYDRAPIGSHRERSRRCVSGQREPLVCPVWPHHQSRRRFPLWVIPAPRSRRQEPTDATCRSGSASSGLSSASSC